MSSTQPTPDAPPVPQHWEGEGTLHSYCYDYMRKRGWSETASAFAADSGINEAEWIGPPIEAPQGLLYEWWSVFWAVFIARSHSMGKRNAIADAYVETMRSQRDPVTIQFAGQPPSQNITLPRSTSHPLRSAPPGGPRTGYANPGQIHVLQQQQLQEQLQQGRTGPPLSAGGPRSAPPIQSTSQYPYAPPPPHHQPHQPPPSPYTNIAYPSRPSSAQSMHSPRIPVTPHSYTNGGPPLSAGGFRGQPSIVTQCLASIGLAGRDADTLSAEEQMALTNQLRRVGALMPVGSPQQPLHPQQQLQHQTLQQQQHQFRAQQSRMASHQQIQQHQQRLSQEQQQRMQTQQYSHQTQQQHAQHQAQQYQVMQQQQQRMLQNRPPGSFPGQSSSQAPSPASPAYSSAPSPFANTLPTSSAPSPAAYPVPIPSSTRGASAGKGRGTTRSTPATTAAAAKRGAVQLEEAGPRARKRPKGAVKDTDIAVGNGDARYENSEPPSPANSTPGQFANGQPSFSLAPSPSIMQQDMPVSNNTRLAQQALEMTGASITSRQHSNHSDPSSNGVGDIKINSGLLSRPGSTAPTFRRSPCQNDPSQLPLVAGSAPSTSLAGRSIANYPQQQQQHPSAPMQQPQQHRSNGQNGSGHDASSIYATSVPTSVNDDSISLPPSAGSNTFAYSGETLFENMGLEFFDSFIDFEADKEDAVNPLL